MQVAKVECPQCHRVWIAMRTDSDVDCNCHLFCSSGTKPQDCVTTLVSLDHEVSWPYGHKAKSVAEGDPEISRQRYCSTHSKYIHKIPIVIPVNWPVFLSKRAPKKFRMLTT